MGSGLAMRRITPWTAALAVALCLSAAAQEKAAELQRKVEACSRHVSERFVFFLGGSGLLISEDGYCLTNYHVVAAGSRDGAVKLTQVTLHNGRGYPARLICTDEHGDVALYKLAPPKGEKFPFLELGDSDKLEPGRYVMACGNPFGRAVPAADRKMYPALSLGIVSVVHRNQGTYFDCIQTDAAVNPGNSGGPLVTLDGKLAGITGRIATRYRNRANSGVGYAISANQIRNFLPLMKKGGDGGRVHHGQINGLVLARGISGGRGAWVYDVSADTTAERAGFRRDDFIIAVGGKPVTGRSLYLARIGTHPMGSKVKVRVVRGEKELDLEVRLDRFQNVPAGFGFGGVPKSRRTPGYLGAQVESEDGRLVVKYVAPGSPAEAGGVREGDVLLRFNGTPLAASSDYRARLEVRQPGDTVKLTVQRKDGKHELEVTLSKRP